MIGLKLCGALIVIFALGGAGILTAKNYQQHPQQIKSIRIAFRMLETEIAYAATPLPEALAKISGYFSLPVALLFSCTREALLSGEGLTATEAWGVALTAFAPQASLKDEDLEILQHFGSGLGNSDREEQVKNLKLVQEQLKVQEQKAETEREKNEKLWRTLGFLMGAVVALILF